MINLSNITDFRRLFANIPDVACNRKVLRFCLHGIVVGKVLYHTTYAVPQNSLIAGRNDCLKIDHVLSPNSSKYTRNHRCLLSNVGLKTYYIPTKFHNFSVVFVGVITKKLFHDPRAHLNFDTYKSTIRQLNKKNKKYVFSSFSRRIE